MSGDILILAPRGRDACVIAQVLDRAGVACRICADWAEALDRLDGEIDALLVTEEALAGPGSAPAPGVDRSPAALVGFGRDRAGHTPGGPVAAMARPG